MSRVVGFEDQGAILHLRDPVLRKLGGFQKTARPLNPRQAGRNSVGRRELRSEVHLGSAKKPASNQSTKSRTDHVAVQLPSDHLCRCALVLL